MTQENKQSKQSKQNNRGKKTSRKNQSKSIHRILDSRQFNQITNSQRNFASLIALRFVKGIGRHRAHWLFSRVEQPADIWTFTDEQWTELLAQEEVPHQRIAIQTTHKEAVQAFDSWDKVKQILTNTKEIGTELLPFWADAFQHQLYHIPDPPLVLWAKGNLELLFQPTIAIVGTRRPSLYAQQQTRAITQECIVHGLTVVSGLALGIDTIAQSECVRQKAPTIAVLGSALNCIYPKQHQRIAQQILDQGGLLLSEYPPHTQAEAHHFPERNRIISGLSKAVLVMESGLKGGSMITARLALDQGREVFVLPHQRDNPKGLGNLHLVQEGAAHLFLHMENLFELIPEFSVLGTSIESVTETFTKSSIKEGTIRASNLNNTASELDAIKSHILSLLTTNNGESSLSKLYEDILSTHSGLAYSKLSIHLMELEMIGWIQQLPGGVIRLLRPLNLSL